MQLDLMHIGIVGARGYIFSENIGVLGDSAAGKEQTFTGELSWLARYLGSEVNCIFSVLIHVVQVSGSCSIPRCKQRSPLASQ